MICPIDPEIQCSYEEPLEKKEMTCEDCEVCQSDKKA